jgi:hypothetical protein
MVLRMLAHNLTTIEFCENRDIADREKMYSHYHINCCDNYRSVLGKSVFLFFLPFCMPILLLVLGPNYDGDGIHFAITYPPIR